MTSKPYCRQTQGIDSPSSGHLLVAYHLKMKNQVCGLFVPAVPSLNVLKMNHMHFWFREASCAR